jgi:hypothetical protein
MHVTFSAFLSYLEIILEIEIRTQAVHINCLSIEALIDVIV